MERHIFPRSTGAISPPADPLVRIEELWRSYRGRWGRKVHALQGVNLEVRAGEVTGLLGPNGAGKTTTLKILLGMLRPSRGRAFLFGRPVSDPAARRRVGFLTEQPYFYDYLTAREFLDLCGVLCGLDGAVRRRRADELLERVGLTAAAGQRLRKYSKGMLQRLGLAQALLHEPALVILDEPMSGLDPLGRGLVRDVILDLKRQGVTILFSSHILPDVEMLCDRVYVLAGGRVITAGSVSDLAAEADPGFEIVASGVPDRLAERFRAAGCGVRPAGSRTLVEVPDRPSMNRVVGELLAAGAELIGVSPERSPLEAHFLKAVADAARPRGSGPAADDALDRRAGAAA